MLIDELVDRRLVGRFDLLELQAHSDSPIAPGNPRFRFDVALRAGQPESGPHFGSTLQRTHGPDSQAAFTEVERERGGDRIAEPVGDRDPEHDARAPAAIEVVREEMWRERGQDVL